MPYMDSTCQKASVNHTNPFIICITYPLLSLHSQITAWLQDCETITGYENTGCAQSMYANRLSFFYDFHGPSMNIDTACSSALVALVQACQAIESGEIDMAIVGGSSITLHPGVSSIL